MSNTHNEVYKQHRTAQDKYTYFLLAVAAAAIAFSVQRTTGSALEWSMIPLGLAVLCWGASFYCGCVQLKYVISTLFANFTLLEIERGTHPDVPKHPDYIQAASDGIRDAIESNSHKSGRFANAQFRLLIFGAVLFIAWHVLGLASGESPSILTRDAPSSANAPVISSSSRSLSRYRMRSKCRKWGVNW